MKLVISQLKDGENPLSFSTQQDSWLKSLEQQLGAEGYALKGDLLVTGTLHKHEPDYYLQGILDFTVTQECSRCAEGFSLPVHSPFNLALAHISAGKKHKKTEAISEESEELDVIYFDGHEIDLKPIIHEQFVLSLPYNSLCNENCKGICQHCGQNLNRQECSCVKTPVHNPFSVLKTVTF